VSTILDALRRLQRERSRDLEESVAFGTDGSSGGRSYAPRLALLVLLLALAGGVAAWTIWPGAQAFQESWSALLAPEPAPEPAPGATTVAALPKPAAAEPPAPVAPERNQPTGLGARPPNLTPEALAARRAAARDRAAQRAERVARGRVAKPPQEPVPVANATPSPGDSQRLAARQAQDPAFLNAPEPKPPPPMDIGLQLEPAPPKRERASEPAEAAKLIAAPTATGGFPDLSVHQVRWHPDPARREALILLDEMRPFDAREGDIISGVVVHRIDPGSVEFRRGDTGFVIGP
jgi:hypothetical protein